MLARRATAEIFGTFTLVLFGCGAVVMDSFPTARYGLMGIALVHGLALSVAVSATMGISGGHLNPAVTLGMLTARRISPSDAAVYVVSQLAGALFAVAVAKWLMPASVGDLAAWGTPALNPAVTFSRGVGTEALLTFFLMSAVMGTAVARNAPKIGGFGIGLTLLFAILIGGPLTGAELNPARAFAPGLLSVNRTALVFWCMGPFLGAIVAEFLWDRVLVAGERESA
jgi:MIP family channel proteins